MEALESAVARSCRKRDAWQAKIAAGVEAALVYASKNPGPAGALDSEAAVGHFTELLGEVAGVERLPASTDRAVVGSIAAVIADHLRRGQAERLPDVAGDMIELSLLPYVGFAAARHWSTSF
jgi:hypothetical protein